MAARDYILHNFWWKLFSLLLAALTWFTIQTVLERDQTLVQSPIITVSTREFPAVPIHLMATTHNTNRFRTIPPEVTVELSGGADMLKGLDVKEITAFVDVSEIGEEKLARRDVHVEPPRNLKIVGIKPPNVSVERITE
ncbi:MAG TPA: CdaR family protein [Verrucomicrobiae bacterium]|jgi:hypothetical protein|nr:CdaR family protein [Verrucomicrobiae bacterium]